MSVRLAGYCPMGCGQTLFVAAGGYITCARLTCPRPDAVASLLEDQETDHVVAFGLIGFTIRHPLRERLGDALMGCDLHAWCAELPGPLVTSGPVRMREASLGRWEVIG